MIASFLPGFALGLGLIVAIGAQNAFVLRQGLRRSHVFAVCLTCALSDAILIAAGAMGMGALSESAPWIQPIARWGGAAFLVVYGAISLRTALLGGEGLTPSLAYDAGRRGAVLTALALTWLNPHVYLETVVLIGSISTEYEADQIWFVMGAISASFAFFFSLGYGARMLAPVFATPSAWRVLDLVIGLTMWAIAASLILT
jgi:L-lysine exporter family protein LysE/ArgO